MILFLLQQGTPRSNSLWASILICQCQGVIEETNVLAVDDIIASMSNNISDERDQLVRARTVQRYYHCQTLRPPTFQPNDMVLLSTTHLDLKLPSQKLTPLFIGGTPWYPGDQHCQTRIILAAQPNLAGTKRSVSSPLQQLGPLQWICTSSTATFRY